MDMIRKKTLAPASIAFGSESKTGLDSVRSRWAENIFERMTRGSGQGGRGTVRATVVNHGNPGAIHGAKATTSAHVTGKCWRA